MALVRPYSIVTNKHKKAHFTLSNLNCFEIKMFYVRQQDLEILDLILDFA